jgi:hypothetical protein
MAKVAAQLSTLLVREQDLYEELLHVVKLLDEARPPREPAAPPEPPASDEPASPPPVDPPSHQGRPPPPPPLVDAPESPAAPASPASAASSPQRAIDLGRDGDADAFNARNFWYVPPPALAEADDVRPPEAAFSFSLQSGKGTGATYDLAAPVLASSGPVSPGAAKDVSRSSRKITKATAKRGLQTAEDAELSGEEAYLASPTLAPTAQPFEFDLGSFQLSFPSADASSGGGVGK